LNLQNGRKGNLLSGGLIEELYYAKKEQAERKNTEQLESQQIESYDYSEIIDEFCTFFFAGTETTAHLLTLTIIYLSKYPEITDKLRSEIKSVIKSDSDFTKDNLNKLEYMNCVLNEVLRMYGPVSGIILREVLKEHSLGGVTMSLGTLVRFDFVPNRYNPMYFKDPEEFRPERWLEESKNPDAAYTVLAFSAGRRNCIGQHLAMMEAKIMLSKFLMKYDFEIR